MEFSFSPGYESSANLGVFPGEVTGELRAAVQHRPLKSLFDNITERGGLVIYPHPEAKHRRWDLTNFQGMEIYKYSYRCEGTTTFQIAALGRESSTPLYLPKNTLSSDSKCSLMSQRPFWKDGIG